MSYQEINIGNQPNDGLGDGARTGAGKINEMFHNRFTTIFIKDNRWLVTRRLYNQADTDIISWRVDDKVEGWHDPATKSRWVEGIILDDTINLSGESPADVDDSAKFFITNQKVKAV
jgi:hypothetical protein